MAILKQKTIKPNKKKNFANISKKQHILNITGTLNNTFFNLTNIFGESIYNTSCGGWNFTGTRKVSSFAIKDVGRNFMKWMEGKNIKDIHVRLIGLRRKTLRPTVKSLIKRFNILTLTYPITRAFNGCRQRKQRRQ